MNPAVESIVCSIVASIICDVGKCGLGQLKYLRESFQKDDIEKYVFEKLEQKYDILCESGVFIEFSDNPLVIDTINNYIIYVITGRIEKKLPEKSVIKKNKNQIIEEKEVVDFLANNLMNKYEESNVLVKPSLSMIKVFFRRY